MDKIMKFITDFFPPTLESLFWMLLKIAIIIAVIMIVMEILKALKVLDWLNKVLFHFTKHFSRRADDAYRRNANAFIHARQIALRSRCRTRSFNGYLRKEQIDHTVTPEFGYTPNVSRRPRSARDTFNNAFYATNRKKM